VLYFLIVEAPAPSTQASGAQPEIIPGEFKDEAIELEGIVEVSVLRVRASLEKIPLLLMTLNCFPQ
jgi:hypothetical protein